MSRNCVKELLIKQTLRLAQTFHPNKETNQTHSKGYAEDLLTRTGGKRCTKVAVLNLSVILSSTTNPPRNWRGIARENMGERTALSGGHQVMDA